MTVNARRILRWSAAVSLVALFCGLPVSFRFSPVHGLVLVPTVAHADGGNSGSGGGGGNSGSGGGGDHEDDEEDNEEDDEEDDEEDGGAENGGGNGGGANDDACRRQGTSGGANAGCGPRTGGDVLRVEVSGSGIDIRYANGSRERIERGRYERRDAAGRVLERRRATGADVTRLRALSGDSAIRSGDAAPVDGAEVAALVVTGDDIAVDYANGWREEITAGSYLLKDPFGRTVARRPATRADRARLIDQVRDRP